MRRNCLYTLLIIGIALSSCGNNKRQPADEPVIVMTAEKMNDAISRNIREVMGFASKHEGKINDNTSLFAFGIVQEFYQSHDFKNIWSDSEKRNPLADSLFEFIKQARNYGLFPSDYHESELADLHQSLSWDSLAIRNAARWTQLDLLSTDAFFMILKDLKEGRIVEDSVSITAKQNWIDSFFIRNMEDALASGSLTELFDNAEPELIQYQSIRQNLKSFVDNMDTTQYVQVQFPYDDTTEFRKRVYTRLLQEGTGNADITIPDSIQFADALKQYQKKHGLESDGKAGPATVGSLNNTDRNKFIKAAVTLDRYKQIESLPETFIWVNIPAFRLELWDADSIVMTSKVIVGKPQTPTPELTSNINNLVIYPNWTIPASIIKKDILPQLKKDPGYLARKGYNLFTDSGTVIDPYSVNWEKYKIGIPWKVVQGSGDDNALGIFKFNFNNPYDVYLHDTNQRYLFANSNRALSHGCVRVQNWQKLANFIADRDSALLKTGILNYSKDSIRTWVNNQVRKSIMVKNRLPLYIVYFTCAAHDNKLEFYDDIYGRDGELIKKYFKNTK